MKRVMDIHVVALAISLTAAAAVRAQENGGSFALGLGLKPVTLVVDEADFFTSLLGPQVYASLVNEARTTMIEPSIGLFRFSEERSGTPDFSQTATQVQIGAGLLFLRDSGERGSTYVGPRFAVSRVSESFESGTSESSSNHTDYLLAVVFGGEYFIVERFGLGGEVGLGYTRVGQDSDAPVGSDVSTSFLRTTAEVRLRWYLR